MPALDAEPDLSSRARHFCTGAVCAAKIVELAVQVGGMPRFAADGEDTASRAWLHGPLAVASTSGAAAPGPIAQVPHRRSQLSGLGHSQEAETITENAHSPHPPSLRQAQPPRISALQ